VVVGDGGHEAYTAILWGVRLSRESSKVAEAEAVSNVEGNTCGTGMRGAVALPWSKTTSRSKGWRRNPGLRRGRLWEISGSAGRPAAAPVRVGKAEEAVADDARAGEVGQVRSTQEVLEQRRAIGRGGDGGKAPGQGETVKGTIWADTALLVCESPWHLLGGEYATAIVIPYISVDVKGAVRLGPPAAAPMIPRAALPTQARTTGLSSRR